MVTFIEPLYKSQFSILFVWAPEPGNVAKSYNVYVGQTPVPTAPPLVLLQNVSNAPGTSPAAPGKVAVRIYSSSVLSALSLSSGDFTTNTFYFTLTYVDFANSQSSLTTSKIVMVPPVGIVSSYMRDDPTTNRHPYVFSPDLQCWVKASGSSNGATIVDQSDYYKANITTVYTYDSSSRVSVVRSYPSDATMSGMPAKLTTYSYSGISTSPSKIQITDSTVV
jgi:hypothetical protein